MPTSASASAPITSSSSSSGVTGPQSRLAPEDLIRRLSSSTTSNEAKLKAIRDIKNQIIGNRTKKLSFLKLGAVPFVVAVLSSATSAAASRIGFGTAGDDHDLECMIIQSAAAVGSFACGFDAGVKAVLDAGALPILYSLISHHNEKVVDAGARSLKLIYQSKLAPKFDFFQDQNIEFLLSLLDSENENVAGLGASIVTHSCQTNIEQNVLADAGILKRLISLLAGSLIQRDASLESLATILTENPEVITKFMGLQNGRTLNFVSELTRDKYPRTRLLACICLIVIRNSNLSCLQDVQVKTNLIAILLELLNDSGQVGDDAPFALSRLIMGKEEMQKFAYEDRVAEKLCEHLEKVPMQAKRLQGIFLALADLCSQLECCRSRFLSLKGLQFITDALNNDNADVRAAACICLRNVSRSVKNLSAGLFMSEPVIILLLHLLDDASTSVQVAALGAITNIVVDFMTHKSTFMQCGGVKQLVLLSKSMDSTIRVNSLWALRNLMFLVDYRCKEAILNELTQSTLRSLISDPEASVQEQALALLRNLVDGSIECIEYIFTDDGLLLHDVVRQLESASKTEVLLQGMYVLTNVTSGNELHKEAVMTQIFPTLPGGPPSLMIKFLQSSDSRLRTAATWTLVNLSLPSCPGAFSRVLRLRNAGIASQLKNMIHDPCLDVKLRARTALGQFMTFVETAS